MSEGVGMQGRARLAALLVVFGTFAAPVAQWSVFLLVARIAGPGDAGEFAILMAVATPLVTVANWGLRNGLITLRSPRAFADFGVLRLVGVVLAGGLILGFGAAARLDPVMVASVVLFKSADSIADIWYGRWQRRQRLIPFGVAMLLNGVLTIGCAAGLALAGARGPWIVLGSALGSLGSLVIVVVVESSELLGWYQSGGYQLRGSVRRLRQIALECWQIAAAQLLAGLVVNVPTWAVAIFGTSADVGRFAAAAYMVTAGSLAGASLNSVVLGRYHAEMLSTGAGAVRRDVDRGTAIAAVAGLLATISVGVVGVPLFQVVYGDQFAFTWLELSLVALAAALNPGTFLMNAALLAVNLYTEQLLIVGVSLALAILVTAAAVALGLSGVLVGAVCALSASVSKFGLSVYWLHRTVPLTSAVLLK